MNELSFISMMDNGGRRLWADRRKAKIVGFSPERRSGKDRRILMDRRGSKKWKIKKENERRKKFIEFDL